MHSGKVMNGQSTFVPNAPTTCVFTGQAKKRDVETSYTIPLLCDVATIQYALTVLRLKQGHEILEPKACNARYSNLLRDETTSIFAFAAHPHQLRACYAAFVFHLYVSNTTFNRTAMRLLGHARLDVSLAYNAVMLHDAPPAGCMGPVP